MHLPKASSSVSRRSFMRLAGVAASMPILTEAHFAFRKGSSMGRFHVSSQFGFALLRTLLNMLAIESEVIPVNPTTLENRHSSRLSNFAFALKSVDTANRRFPQFRQIQEKEACIVLDSSRE